MKSRNERAAITGVVTPKREDVLSGRGPSCAKHNATTLWWNLVQKEAHKYRGCTSRRSKTLMVTTICNKVHKVGGRFLEKRDSTNPDSVWDEVEVVAVHLKTSQAMRDVRAANVQPPAAIGTRAAGKTENVKLHDRDADGASGEGPDRSLRKHTSTAFDGNETCMGAVNSVLFVNDASSIFGVTEREASQIDFSWEESHVRDAVLENALKFHRNRDHTHPDEDFELQDALLSLATQHQISESPLASTQKDDHSNAQRSKFSPKADDTLGYITVDPMQTVVPALLVPVALPLNEQVSGDSRDWMTDLWPSMRNACSTLQVEQPAPCSVPRTVNGRKRKALPETTVGDSTKSTTARTDKNMKTIRPKTASHAYDDLKKAATTKRKLSSGQSCLLPILQFQPQLSGDSRAWENFNHQSEDAVNMHNSHGISRECSLLIPQKHTGLPNMTSYIPTALRLPPSPGASQKLVDTIAPVPLDFGPLLTPPVLNKTQFLRQEELNTEEQCCTRQSGLSSSGMMNRVDESFSFVPLESSKEPSQNRSIEPALGDLNDILQALSVFHRSSQAFQDFMPKARKVETDFMGMTARLKMNIDGIIFGTSAQERISMNDDIITDARISTRAHSLDNSGYQIDWNHQAHVAV